MLKTAILTALVFVDQKPQAALLEFTRWPEKTPSRFDIGFEKVLKNSMGVINFLKKKNLTAIKLADQF